MAPMNKARHSMTVVVHEPDAKATSQGVKILVFGGVGDKKELVPEIEEYDIENNEWRQVFLKNYGQSPKGAGMFGLSINPQQI